MVLGHFKKIFRQHPWRSNMFFSLLLVILEKVVEQDFMCPCSRGYTEALFSYYLVMPLLIAFMFGFYLVSPEFWKGSRSESELKKKWLQFLAFLTPPVVWVALFLSDGRYVACLQTELKADYADSNDQPPWEWCSQNRTLTADEIRAHNSFYHYKLAGFSLISLILLVALLCKCCKQESEQPTNEATPEPSMQGHHEERNGYQEI